MGAKNSKLKRNDIKEVQISRKKTFENDPKWERIASTWSQELGMSSWGKEIVHMNTIHCNLFMGSRLSAQEIIDKGNLYDQNKQQYSGKDFHIICVASPETCEYCTMSDKFNSYRIHDRADVVADDIKDMIERIVCKMHKKLKKNKVMVHCHSGRNRSALAILAYCAKYTKYTYGDALFQIRSLNSHRFPMQSTLQNNEFTSFMRTHWDEFREKV